MRDTEAMGRMNHELSKRPSVAAMRRYGWVLAAVLSVMTALGAARYFLFMPILAIPNLQARLVKHDPWLLLHIGGGVIALTIGAFQFPARFRNRHLTWHRWLGRVYLVAVLAGSVGGFRIALLAEGGLPTHLGFGVLAVIWFATAAMAYLRIRERRIRAHSEWMIRNFSLTFAAVTLRLWLPLFTAAFGWPFLPSYQAISWLCWVPNLLAAEWLIRNGRGVGVRGALRT